MRWHTKHKCFEFLWTITVIRWALGHQWQPDPSEAPITSKAFQNTNDSWKPYTPPFPSSPTSPAHFCLWHPPLTEQPQTFLPALPLSGLCPLHWPLSSSPPPLLLLLCVPVQGAAVPGSPFVCVPAQFLPARQPSLSYSMPFYSSAEPDQAAQHSG